MRIIISIIIFSIFFSCRDSKTKNALSYGALENMPLKIEGKTVVFLRPDSIKFLQNENVEGIYESDADFGFAIQNTMDEAKKNPKYSSVSFRIATDRFLEIKDCKECPKIVDRDSIFYGILLTAPGKKIKIRKGVLSGNDLEIIEEYFLK